MSLTLDQALIGHISVLLDNHNLIRQAQKQREDLQEERKQKTAERKRVETERRDQRQRAGSNRCRRHEDHRCNPGTHGSVFVRCRYLHVFRSLQRIEPDPLVKILFGMSIALLAFMIFYAYTHGH